MDPERDDVGPFGGYDALRLSRPAGRLAIARHGGRLAETLEAAAGHRPEPRRPRLDRRLEQAAERVEAVAVTTARPGGKTWTSWL